MFERVGSSLKESFSLFKTQGLEDVQSEGGHLDSATR